MFLNRIVLFALVFGFLFSCKDKKEETKDETPEVVEVVSDGIEAEAVEPETPAAEVVFDAGTAEGGKAAAEKQRAAELATQAGVLILDEEFERGLKLCKKSLEVEPNQQAYATCSIAACNLKLGAEAKEYINAVTNQARKAVLTQICRRLTVPGFQ